MDIKFKTIKKSKEASDVSVEKILMEYLCRKSEKLENGKWYRLSCIFSANTDINEIMLSNMFVGK